MLNPRCCWRLAECSLALMQAARKLTANMMRLMIANLQGVPISVECPGGCYTCRYSGERRDAAVWCARQGGEHVRSQGSWPLGLLRSEGWLVRIVRRTHRCLYVRAISCPCLLRIKHVASRIAICSVARQTATVYAGREASNKLATDPAVRLFHVWPPFSFGVASHRSDSIQERLSDISLFL